jgi:hypothetical protein
MVNDNNTRQQEMQKTQLIPSRFFIRKKRGKTEYFLQVRDVSSQLTKKQAEECYEKNRPKDKMCWDDLDMVLETMNNGTFSMTF